MKDKTKQFFLNFTFEKQCDANALKNSQPFISKNIIEKYNSIQIILYVYNVMFMQ